MRRALSALVFDSNAQLATNITREQSERLVVRFSGDHDIYIVC